MRGHQRYDHIIRLIQLWQKFESDEPGGDIHTFYHWLGKYLSNEQSIEKSSLKTFLQEVRHHQTPQPAEKTAKTQETQHPMPDINGRISILLGRMYRFARFYVKKTMETQAISTLDEFTFLATIFRTGNPTKSDVCSDNITEMTTGVEILRRLQKAGYLEEFTDENDRRVKRVRLTHSGTTVLFSAFAAMKPVGSIVAGELSPEQKEHLLFLLSQLDNFHTTIYAEQRQATLSELLKKNLDQHPLSNE